MAEPARWRTVELVEQKELSELRAKEATHGIA